MVRLANDVALLLRGSIQIQRARVFAAEVVEVRDVVVGLQDQERHRVPLAVLARLR